jgi:hypothetical protein
MRIQGEKSTRIQAKASINVIFYDTHLMITTAKQQSNMFKLRHMVHECQELHKHKHRVSAYQAILVLLKLLCDKRRAVRSEIIKAG